MSEKLPKGAEWTAHEATAKAVAHLAEVNMAAQGERARAQAEVVATIGAARAGGVDVRNIKAGIKAGDPDKVAKVPSYVVDIIKPLSVALAGVAQGHTVWGAGADVFLASAMARALQAGATIESVTAEAKRAKSVSALVEALPKPEKAEKTDKGKGDDLGDEVMSLALVEAWLNGYSPKGDDDGALSRISKRVREMLASMK